MESNLDRVGAVLTTRSGRLLIPTHDWVVCRMVERDIVSPGGIIAPNTDASGAGSNLAELEVIAVGPVSPSSLLVGDRVKIIGQAPCFSLDGATYFLVRDRLVPEGDMRFEFRQIGERLETLPVGPPYICGVIREHKGDA